MKRFVLVCLPIVLALSGCQKPPKAAETGPYSGLSLAIDAWHRDIETQPVCAERPADGHACVNFNVECKASMDLEPGKPGETARIVAAMTWDAWNAKRADYDSASGGAIFAKTNGVWVRKPIVGSINLSTCEIS